MKFQIFFLTIFQKVDDYEGIVQHPSFIVYMKCPHMHHVERRERFDSLGQRGFLFEDVTTSYRRKLIINIWIAELIFDWVK